MAKNLIENIDKIILNTGNILALNEITKNPGLNPSEELAEAIKLTISNYEITKSEADKTGLITCKYDDLVEKMSEHELQDLKIGIKVFLNSENGAFIKQALEKVFLALNVTSVHNVIISLNHKGTSDEHVARIKNIWTYLENYVITKKVQQIGLSDIDETPFRAIYEWSNIKPSIIQINLNTCCVVPPTLQTFCTDNDVLLLTHSDPTEILPTKSIQEIFDVPLVLNWAVRFLVHIKCRGVLTTKGYIISLIK